MRNSAQSFYYLSTTCYLLSSCYLSIILLSIYHLAIYISSCHLSMILILYIIILLYIYHLYYFYHLAIFYQFTIFLSSCYLSINLLSVYLFLFLLLLCDNLSFEVYCMFEYSLNYLHRCRYID